MQLSIVIPCLNEANTIANCVTAAKQYFERAALNGEVVVADNGSTDGSQALAQKAGARVINVEERGYGAALRNGIEAAQGDYVVIGDADQSYDFGHLDAFLNKLHDGFDLVMGNRFQGGIKKGAMPFLHRYLGNPVLSFIGRLFFKAPVGDFHCGLRAFRKDSILRLNLQTNGMEFASEMIVKAALSGMQIAEVPTTLSKDGRNRPPHLRTWRDGWRHLRFLLLFSPRWLFLYPGFVLLTFGVALQFTLYHGGINLGAFGLDIHTMLFSAAMSIIGMQMIWFAIFSKVFGTYAGFLPKNNRLERALKLLTLEKGLAIGLLLLLGGVFLSSKALFGWASEGYGRLDPSQTMRTVIPAVTMMITGMEFILAVFFLGILRIERRKN